MQQISHQTVKLGRGRHTSPEYGACVMELASMLAGEPFSDHPRCVSPPIASFLRAYNDMLDDERRQDLYEYAAKTVGTAASRRVERARAERLIAWGDETWEQYTRSVILGRFRRRRRVMREGRGADPLVSARYAIQSIRRLSNETHAAVLALVDELIAMGVSDQARAAVSDVAPASSESPMISATNS